MTPHKPTAPALGRTLLTCAICSSMYLFGASIFGANSVSGAEPEPMPLIPPGTSFNTDPPAGWSNIVLFVNGRLASGDVAKASAKVHRYAKMFNLVILADVGKDDQGLFRLHKVGVGFTTKIKDRNTVITIETEEELGAELGYIARSVFKANEESLSEIKRVVRSKNHVLFDAPTIMLYEDEHETMMVRYLVWASPKNGSISTFVWLLDNPEDDRDYKTMEAALQMLPENMHEDRIMNVKGDRFTFGIPSKDAFALVRIPQGKAIPFTPTLSSSAGRRSYDATSFTELLKAITNAVQQSVARRDLRP